MAERELKFEEAMERLETISGKLESEETALEDAIRLYEEGIKLVKVCEKKLAAAEAKLEKVLPESTADRAAKGPLNLREN
ncbi:exodeoxyribonuclease VII small subunit [bacterium]|nr:exodeoxyribonuclease VII small subunit [bacterium]